ncbi:MAG TPA: exo-alpha-sialidase [Opitutaceae bacterium]|nr:exo-alpha-sialidase [Opitutaceae bacterium]
MKNEEGRMQNGGRRRLEAERLKAETLKAEGLKLSRRPASSFQSSYSFRFQPSAFSLLLFLLLCLQPSTSVASSPLIYSDTQQITTASDGGLRPVIGVQNIQVYRANRTHSAHADRLAHTYSHQPMLAWWRGKFYLEYLSVTRNEHDEGTVNSLTTSADGVTWTAPRVVFPAFALPDGSRTITHQRMGFYVAPDGRFLVLGFYGKHPAPNDGTGIGRAVREIHEDGTFGPIYFILMNAKQPFPGFAAPYPFFTTSTDKVFVDACQTLLADKLMTAQWWEEDQLDSSGFYKIKGKALSFVHRRDGSVLGIWKNALVATTRDEGQTWTEKQFATNLPNNASKYWLQHTGDERFALFFNPTNRLRHPLAVATSEDGETFSDLLAVHGELPDQRFGGNFKNMGPQYVRGIVEGNGAPPDSGSATWVAYSVNKEDIWISRVPVPITGYATPGAIEDNFENTAAGAFPAAWNIYSPLWAPVRVVDAKTDHDGGVAATATHALELRDEDPYDYARAVRVFAPTHGVKISFRVLARQTNARLEIELLDAHGARPVRLALGEDGHVWACHEGQWFDAGTYTSGAWHRFELEIPPSEKADRCALMIDGKSPLARPAIFTDPVTTVERLSFRTGPYRYRGYGGRDLPGADEKVPAASFLIDDVGIVPMAK